MNELKNMADVMDHFFEVTSTKKMQKPHGYETTIEINGYEFDCIVDYEYERGCKGATGDFGMQIEPDTESCVTMGDVYIFDSKWTMIDIPELAMTDILEEIRSHEED